MEFNRTDPSVLSTNVDVHLSKVLEGKYAYIGDKTLITLFRGENCELITAKEDVLHVYYAPGLPNNSPYKILFSDK